MPVINVRNKTWVITEDQAKALNDAKEKFRDELKVLKEEYDIDSKKLAQKYFDKVYEKLGYDKNDSESLPVLRVDDEYYPEGIIIVKEIEKVEDGEPERPTTH